MTAPAASNLTGLKSLLLNLRRSLLQREVRIRVLKPTPRLPLLELHTASLARADTHARSPRAPADRPAGAAARAAVRVVDAPAHSELVALAFADGAGAGVDGGHVAALLCLADVESGKMCVWCGQNAGEGD